MYFRFILETNTHRIVSYINIVYPVLQMEILNNLPDVASGFFIALKRSCPAASNQGQQKTNTPSECRHVLSVFFSPGQYFIPLACFRRCTVILKPCETI